MEIGNFNDQCENPLVATVTKQFVISPPTDINYIFLMSQNTMTLSNKKNERKNQIGNVSCLSINMISKQSTDCNKYVNPLHQSYIENREWFGKNKKSDVNNLQSIYIMTTDLSHGDKVIVRDNEKKPSSMFFFWRKL